MTKKRIDTLSPEGRAAVAEAQRRNADAHVARINTRKTATLNDVAAISTAVGRGFKFRPARDGKPAVAVFEPVLRKQEPVILAALTKAGVAFEHTAIGSTVRYPWSDRDSRVDQATFVIPVLT